MKRLSAALVVGVMVLAMGQVAFAQSTGDIAFIGWNSDGDDDIVFLTCVDISVGTKIYFRDDEYNNGWDGIGEGTISWTAPAGGISAGAVVQIYDCSNSPTTSTGSVSEENAGFDISNIENAVYAYLSTNTYNSGSFTFLAAFCNASSFGDFLNGTGLSDGTDAWSWGNKDNWKYVGSTTSETVDEMKTFLQNSENWEFTDGSGDQSYTFSFTDFTLPVTLTSFTATPGDGEVTLKWVTESERDNLGFYICRSRFENRDYQQITGELIPGAGNSVYRNEYEYVDKGLTNGVTYWYKLEDVDYDGLKTQHGPVSATPTAKVRPTTFQLSQNYPNPFNPLTVIRYQIPEDGKVVLGIYNLLGQPIKTLVEKEQEAGPYQVEWDGKDGEGSRVGSGIYFYRLKTGDFVRVKKMVFLD